MCLVLTAIKMPGRMNRLALAHSVHDRLAPVKLVVVSALMRPCQADLPLRARFVEKPCQMATMIDLLRSLIASPAPPVADTDIG